MKDPKDFKRSSPLIHELRRARRLNTDQTITEALPVTGSAFIPSQDWIAKVLDSASKWPLRLRDRLREFAENAFESADTAHSSALRVLYAEHFAEIVNLAYAQGHTLSDDSLIGSLSFPEHRGPVRAAIEEAILPEIAEYGLTRWVALSEAARSSRGRMIAAQLSELLKDFNQSCRDAKIVVPHDFARHDSNEVTIGEMEQTVARLVLYADQAGLFLELAERACAR